MFTNSLNTIRRQLLASGYSPLPNEHKACRVNDWNNKKFYAKEIKRYGSLEAAIDTWDKRHPKARSTGVRLQDGLGAIDGDVDDKDLSSALCDVLDQVVPHVAADAPIRMGGGQFKAAWFVRFTGDAFVRMASHKYARPADLAQYRLEVAAAIAEAEKNETAPRHVEKPEYHCVEIFGGAPYPDGRCSRQFGVYGPHSSNPDGTVKREYRWLDKDLAGVRLSNLPAVSKVEASAIIDGFDAAAQALGWEMVIEQGEGEGAGGDVFDISRKRSKFEVLGHGIIDYAELEALVQDGQHVVCTANFIKDELSDTKDRCKAVWSERFNCVCVKDWKTSLRHYPDDVGKTDHSMRDVADVMERLKKATGAKKPGDGARAEAPEPEEEAPEPFQDDAQEPPEPGYEGSIGEKVAWLIESHGYFTAEHSVVRLYSTSLDCRSKVSAFHERYAAWYHMVPKGHAWVREYATELWSLVPYRRHLAGVRMTPDAAFPLYIRDGQMFKNTYRKPAHVRQGGKVGAFMRFLERFIPDVKERTWLLDWMAHKIRRPDIPGQAIIFVADGAEDTRNGVFGTGRGIMFTIARLLFGTDYTRAQSFAMLEGSSGQATYTDWMHGSILVTVDESKTSATAHRRGERSATYELLKDIVDPAPKLHRFNGKYRIAFDGMCYASFWVATNHADAIAIPDGDRRFTILRNGRKMLQEEIAEIIEWRDNPANIGALWRALETRDITAGFDMFQPLETDAKAEMAKMSLSQVEHVLNDFIDDKDRGLVFTRGHLLAAIRGQMGENEGPWMGQFEGCWHRYTVGLDTANGSPRRVRVGGKRQRIYCFRVHRKAAEELPEPAFSRQANRWGPVDGEQDPFTVHSTQAGTQGKSE
jgi:hypothetical protein